MILGRHRGLPFAIDSTVRTPDVEKMFAKSSGHPHCKHRIGRPNDNSNNHNDNHGHNNNPTNNNTSSDNEHNDNHNK